MRAKFKTFGRFDMASRSGQATVTIDRAAGLFTVRPYRKRKPYTLPLSTVAEMVVRAIIRAEVAEKARARGRTRLARRGAL